MTISEFLRLNRTGANLAFLIKALAYARPKQIGSAMLLYLVQVREANIVYK